MDEIKKNLNAGKLVIGTKRTIKAIKNSQVEKIFLANNCPEIITEDIEYYGAFDNVPVEKLNIACDELGIVCKKPFLISVVSILK
jgi:large subunit ribosomal protein L30e